MEKLTDILAMGGWGAYVWPSYLAAAIILAGLLGSSLRASKRAQSALSQLERNSDADEA